MQVKITVDVQDYHPINSNGQIEARLQYPIAQKRHKDGKALFRQLGGPNNNQVRLEDLHHLAKADSLPHSVYVHGISIASNPKRGHRAGDPVWLADAASRYAELRRGEDTVSIYNLRTFQRLTVSIHEICWVPKYRKLDGGGGGRDELLTIAGPTVLRLAGKKSYVLVVVQNSSGGDGGPDSAKATPPLFELKELLRQHLFGYENMERSPGGERRIRELFHQTLAIMAPALTIERPRTPAAAAMIQEQETTTLITPPPDGGDETDSFQQRVLALKKKVCDILVQGPPSIKEPDQYCNLPKSLCPTPPRTFITFNRPTLADPFPTHHHLAPTQCPAGARHRLHCVLAGVSLRGPCIIPHTVRHTCCCRTRGSVSVSWGSGGGGGGGGVDDDDDVVRGMKVEVQPAGFVVERDLDEWGRMWFGIDE